MKRICCLFIFWLGTLQGTQILPWIDHVLEPVVRVRSTYQHFRQLQCSNRSVNYPGNDLLLEGWLFFAPSEENAFELEVLATRTHRHNLAINGFKQAYSFVYMNDSVGDCISLSSGFSFTENFKIALRDPSIINHGNFEVEWNLQLGNEWSCGGYRLGRVFGLFAMGVANRGMYWLRGYAAGEYAFCGNQTVLFKLEAEAGRGERSLCRRPFRCYGETAYRLLDATFRYSYQTDCNGTLSLVYLQRLLCRNTPYAIQRVTLEWEYPFNL